jgi:hypothetical protein
LGFELRDFQAAKQLFWESDFFNEVFNKNKGGAGGIKNNRGSAGSSRKENTDYVRGYKRTSIVTYEDSPSVSPTRRDDGTL